MSQHESQDQSKDSKDNYNQRHWHCGWLALYRYSTAAGSSQPSKEAGTTIARIVLSGLAETSRLAEGLNRRAVGGKECA